MTERVLSVLLILDRLGREELLLKQIGAYEQAHGVRGAIIQILKLSDETPPQPPLGTETLVT